MKKISAALACAALSLSPLTWAHDGHGLSGSSHWHATDVWGFVGLCALVMMAIFVGRK
jgi:hypothetical protein